MDNKILIVEDNRKLADLFSEALSERFPTETAFSLKEALNAIGKFDGYLLDMQLPDGEGLELIPRIKRHNPEAVIIVATAYGTVQKAVDALKLGATDFLEKPVDLEALLERFCDLIPVPPSDCPVAASPAMEDILRLARQVADTPFPVLIIGDTGTGKEVLARHIHNLSSRDKLISVNCASLPEHLADSLLFGHLKGSFTGASDHKQGLVEAAHNGTLFLDEIGEMPLDVQAKLLRFLDTGCFMPVGSSREKRSEVRIIAATNRDLTKFIKEGKFRQDLYFRLSTFPIFIPPLKARPEDIEPLAIKHLNKLCSLLGQEVTIEKEAIERLRAHNFPGNVRELFNILDRAAVTSRFKITRADLNHFLTTPENEKDQTEEDFWTRTRSHANDQERELIIKALEKTRWNKAAAARNLKISYKTLLNKMKKLGIS